MRCPYCGSRSTWKIQPLSWMRHIRPRMRNRRCSDCGHEFALWYHRFTYRHSTAHSIIFIWNVVVWCLIILLLVDIYRMTIDPQSSILYILYSVLRNLIFSLFQKG